MWFDNDIDNAFRRLDPAEHEPTPFPLDAWLKLEAGLDQAVIDRAVRRRLWQFFAAEVAVVALVGLGWSLWPVGTPVAAGAKAQTVASASLPMGKTADGKSLKASAGSRLTVAPRMRAGGVGSLTATMPRPVAGVPAAANASAETSAATAAAVATVSPVRAAIGDGPHRPLAVALTPGRHAVRTARPYSVDGPLAMSGKGARLPVEPTAGRSESNLAIRKAKPTAEALAIAAAPVTKASRASAQTLLQAENGSSTETASRYVAAPARATAGEVAVADAASPSGSPTAATAAGQTAAGRVATGANIPPGSTTEAGTRPGDATTDDLIPATPPTVAALLPAAELLPAQLALAEATMLPLPAVVREPRFYVGVVAAPDVSTVKFAEVKGARLNLGLTLEYRLGQRWRLATGVQRATKDYYARREDYDWTDYPRAQTRDFSWVEGACTVLDVPLNLRYDALVQAHARWFGTAGLSSFFMQRENYSYDYLEGGTYKTWEMPGLVNANRHLFSVLNLSAGYEYGLGTHWRLQAEPYVKVPLAGVGAGKVKLLSAGFYFGLKYGF